MEIINPHNTAIRDGGKWWATRGDATDVLAAARRAEWRYWLLSSLLGAALGVWIVAQLPSVTVVSGSGVFLIVACIVVIATMGAVTVYAPRDGRGPRGPRGTIPGALLSYRAALQVTPETRDRLARAHEEHVLDEALAVVEREAREHDSQRARRIMHDEPSTTSATTRGGHHAH